MSRISQLLLAGVALVMFTDAVDAAPALKDKSPVAAGAWVVRYHPNGAARVYIVSADGEVAFPDGGSKAKLKLKDKEILVDFADGKLERWTVGRDGRLFVEHFNPRSNYPDTPDQIGIGILKPADR